MPAAAAGQPNSEDPSREQRSKLAAGLRDLADRIEQQPELMSRAADLMSQDFMDNCAPPPQVLHHVLWVMHLAWRGCRSQLVTACTSHVMLSGSTSNTSHCVALCWWNSCPCSNRVDITLFCLHVFCQKTALFLAGWGL